jgi:hypothetical protein
LKVLATSRAATNQKKIVAQERRIGASRVICNLPTIEEDQVDEELLDVGLNHKKIIGRLNEIVGNVGKPKRLQKLESIMRIDYNSDSNKLDK